MPVDADLTQWSPDALWSRYGDAVVAGGFNVLAALAILVAGIWIANRIGGFVQKAAARNPRVDRTLSAFIGSIIRYGLFAIVAIAVLDRFGVQTTQIVAVLGAATLAIGLALQGTLSNVAAGVMLILFRPYRIGDFVEVAGQRGVVRDVTFFTTELATLDNIKVVLPNAQCWGAPILNFSFHEKRRLDLPVTVAYGSDLGRTQEALSRLIAADPRVLADPAPAVRVTNLGDFAITVTLMAWCRGDQMLDLRADLLRAIPTLLAAEGVEIPFPTSVTYHVEGAPGAKP